MTALLNILENHIFVEGTYKKLKIYFYKKSDGTTYDFTGVTLVEFTLKKNQTDTTALVYLTSVANPTQVEYGGVDPGAGYVRITFEASDTEDLADEGTCWWQIKVTKGGKPDVLGRGPWSAFTHLL